MRLKIAVVFVALAAASLMMQRGMQAQTPIAAARLFVPILQASPEADLGLAFSNPTLDSATVTLTAHAYDGSRISGSGITNPATMTLPARGQRALGAAEVFGAAISGRSGWIEVAASSAAIKGFFLVFDAKGSYIDGAPFVESPASRLVFPKASPSTTVSFANTGSQNYPHAALSLFDDNGQFVDRAFLSVAPSAGRSGTIADFFPAATGFSGYAILEADATPFGTSGETLVAVETYRNRADVAVLTASPFGSEARTGYLPHFVTRGGYYSAVGLVNNSSQSQRVRITADGLNRTPSSASVERTVPAFGRVEERVDSLFGFSGDAVITGYIHYDVQDNGGGLFGYVEYGGSDGLLLSAAPAQGSGLSDFYFSQVAEGGDFYTGLALLNPNLQAVSVTVDAFNTDGKRTATTAVRLDAGLRRSQLLSELFPSLGQQVGGYIHVTASRPIFAFQLFGSRTSLSILANVSAQGSVLRPQAGGRTVVASKGANVLSNDGSISVAIPPGALATDTPVRIDAVAISDLPSPGAGQRTITAIEAQPAGTRFLIPVRLTFPIAVQLPPNTTLPLVLFNPQTKQYEATEFTAVVDESGRTASAEVTHFSTYGITLSDAQLLNVTGISPSSGLPGASVTISGSGFSLVPGENLVMFAGADNAALTAAVTSAVVDKLTVTVPAGAVTGYVTVRVGAKSSVGVVFTVPQDQPRPSISSLSPSKTELGTTSVDIEISGSGFRPTSTLAYGASTTPFTYVDSTLLLVSLNTAQLKPGIQRFVVTNAPPGGGASNGVEFTVAYPRPTISSITPSQMDYGDDTKVTIQGSGFSADSTVNIGGIAIRPTLVNATTLLLPVSTIAPGNYLVTVSNPTPGGGLSNSATFQVRPQIHTAAIQLLDPTSGASTREVVVNEGRSVHPSFLIIDSAGEVRSATGLTFTSVAPNVATVDATGTIQGKKEGFSTFVVSDGDAVAIFTITVVEVNSGAGGVAATGVAADSAKRLYLAATQDHTVLLSQDLKQTPTVYAGIKQTQGLKNSLRLDSLFRRPAFLALNQSEGRLYVSDRSNNAIRRVSPGNSGSVETVADGFNNPQGVGIDNRGYLWVADSGNHTIRRVNLLTGVVDTVAGQAGSPGFIDGNGPAARFNSPVGLAVESETATQALVRERRGDPPPPVHVIVADSGNGAIRRVSETGSVETLFPRTRTERAQSVEVVKHAATLSNEFNSPTGVAVDALGNIYVTESNSGAVKTILANGDVVLAAQPSTFASPQGLAVTETGHIVIADSTQAHEIHFGEPAIISVTPSHVSSKGGETLTITGANFAPETAVVIGGVIASAVTVVDTQTIRLVAPASPSGRTTLSVQNRGGLAQTSLLVDAIAASTLPAGYITTIAGGSTFGGDGSRAESATIATPWGITVDSAGNVLVAETVQHRIRQINTKTNLILTVAGSGQSAFSGDGSLALAAALNDPVGVAVDQSGNIYIADTDNDRIRKVNAATGIITTIAGNGLQGFAGDNGPGVSGSLWSPFGVAVDCSGNVYIADTNNSRIRKVAAATGVITTVAGRSTRGYNGDDILATSASLNFPTGVAVDCNGNIYIADTFNFRIRKVTAATGLITTIAGTGVQGFLGEGIAATAARISYAYGVNLDSVGNVYIADKFNERIRKVDVTNGNITTVAGNGTYGFSGDGGLATSAALRDPTTMAVDAAGNIFIVDTFNLRVRKVSVDTGFISTIGGIGQQSNAGDNGPATVASLELPSAVAFDAAGNLFIADTFNQQIRRVAASTGVITTIAGTGQKYEGGNNGDGGPALTATLANPSGIAIDAAGNVLIADTSSNAIRKVTTATGVITTIAGPAGLAGPKGLAVDAQGNIFIADTENHRVRKIAANTGIITVVAGVGLCSPAFAGDGGLATSACLASPDAVTVDSNGDIYIADTANYRVRKVAAATGLISTIAGTGCPQPLPGLGCAADGLLGVQTNLEPAGLALDGNGNLLIADKYNSRIRKLNLATGAITTIAGGGSSLGDNGPATSARLSYPTGVTVDALGNIVIADFFNSRIRLVRRP